MTGGCPAKYIIAFFCGRPTLVQLSYPAKLFSGLGSEIDPGEAGYEEFYCRKQLFIYKCFNT